MSSLMWVAGAILLTSCTAADQPARVKPTAAEVGSTMLLHGTTWEFEDRGTATLITIDADGNYVENRASGGHVVHGTYRQVSGKDCFTSAMKDKATSCWTAVPPTKVGETASATSDKGQTASFKRVDYRPLSINN